MLGAIYIGLSGMNAYSRGLQTISNNVANLNTLGYKATTVNFVDLSTYGDAALTSEAAASEGKAGSGVRIASPLLDFSQGDLRASDNALDLAIQGNGFLVLLEGSDTYYVRTGQFTVDREGFIVRQGGSERLAVFDGSGRAAALNVDSKRTSPPAATTKVVLADNLSSSATEATVADVPVFDSRGGRQLWTLAFRRPADSRANEWTVTVTDTSGAAIGTSTFKFNGNVVDPATSKITFTVTPDSADPLAVEVDLSAVTSFSSGTASTLRRASSDGNPVGALTTVVIDGEGRIELAYSNEKKETLGAVVIADFRDPQQLERAGAGRFRASATGPVRLFSSGADGIGRLQSRQIEASNINLSDEFGELILIQRGFQAASQVVSVSNDMIQQLFGIRGQG